MQTSSATTRQGKRVGRNELAKGANNSANLVSISVSSLGRLLRDEEHIYVKCTDSEAQQKERNKNQSPLGLIFLNHI